ncbi:MAG: HK97 family phage prohead protease [Chloroflexota bacterium]
MTTHSLAQLFGDQVVAGYLVRFGSPSDRDFHDDYFTKRTEMQYGVKPGDPIPVLYLHGKSAEIGETPLGYITHIAVDEIGVWAQAQLDLSNQYIKAVKGLIAKGALAWSSGSLPDYVTKSADREILRWIIVEGSLTPTPAEKLGTRVALGMSAARLDMPVTRTSTSSGIRYVNHGAKRLP